MTVDERLTEKITEIKTAAIPAFEDQPIAGPMAVINMKRALVKAEDALTNGEQSTKENMIVLLSNFVSGGTVQKFNYTYTKPKTDWNGHQ